MVGTEKPVPYAALAGCGDGCLVTQLPVRVCMCVRDNFWNQWQDGKQAALHQDPQRGTTGR